jgi:hypothetical protein
MSVNHEIEKVVQTDRPSGTLLRLGKEFVVFFKLLYGFYFLGCDSFMGIIPDMLNDMVVIISVTPNPEALV